MYKFFSKMLKEINGESDYNDSFRWKNVDGEYTLEIIDSRVEEFFKLVLMSKRMRGGNDTDLQMNINDYEKFESYFISGAIMSILKDSLGDLSRFFFKRGNRENYPELFSEVFFENSTAFEKYVTEYLNSNSLEDGTNNNFIEKCRALKSDIYCIIPKLTLPVHLYAMSYTIDTLFGALKEYPQIIKKRSLPLFKTASSVYSHSAAYQKTQNDFRNFIECLNKNLSNQNEKLHNNSLNLYMFNELTNLYDLYKSVDMFKESSYMLYEKYELKNDSQIAKEEHKAELEFYFNNFSAITKTDNFGLKSFLLDENYFNKDLINTQEFWDMSNAIINSAKSSLAEFMENESEQYLADVPQEIRSAYGAYLSFAYKNEFFADVIVDICDEEIPVYIYKEDNLKDFTMFEAYGYGYKSFYKAKAALKNKNIATQKKTVKSKVKLIVPLEIE